MKPAFDLLENVYCSEELLILELYIVRFVTEDLFLMTHTNSLYLEQCTGLDKLYCNVIWCTVYYT